MLTPSVDQVARDQWLLDTAEDYFHFVTEFFEVINVSAAHIYHSALELSPTSSIVRKLHYHRRFTPLPRVVVGTPNSWDEHIGIQISHKVDSNQVPFAWSQCGRFIATREQEVVKIRHPLTFEILSTLRSTEHHPHRCYLLHGPAYSPDGGSLACLSNIGIRIWDAQTGGVAKEIECHVVDSCGASLVWSLDGRNILVAYADWLAGKTWTVCTFDVTSGTRLSAGTLQKIDDPYIWAHGTSFRIMAAVRTGDLGELDTHYAIDVFEVGSALNKTESFSCRIQLRGKQTRIRFGSFSPTTHRVSIAPPGHLFILNLQNSERLLEETGIFHAHTHYFSPDGSLFATSSFSSLHIWKYAPDRYIPWRQLRAQDPPRLRPRAGLLSFRFSPASSLVLSLREGFLRVWRLDDPPAILSAEAHDLATVSRCGTHTITAHTERNTVTITNIVTQIPSQIIDTGAKVWAIALTGDVLLTASAGKVTAWPLTEDGAVYGVFGIRRAGCSDSVWTVSPASIWARVFSVDGHTGVIQLAGNDLHTYHTGTGEVLWAPPHSTHRWHDLREVSRGDHRHPRKYCGPFEDDRPARQALFQDGWVKNLEGEYRLWVPTKWRTNYQAYWPSDVIAVHPTYWLTVVIMF